VGFRFYRRVPLLPGLRVNLSKSGASLSIGGRGAWLTVGPRGRRATREAAIYTDTDATILDALACFEG
jgi:hypothetical protein